MGLEARDGRYGGCHRTGWVLISLSLYRAKRSRAAPWPHARRSPPGLQQHPIAEVLERWEHILFPIVLIGLGIVILVSGGAFGL